MLADLNGDQLALAEFMSELSESGYSAAWMKDLEFDLWAILNGGGRKYGQDAITQNQMDQLRSLVERCGCWIVFDDEHEEIAVELEVWRKMYLDKKSIE